MGLHIAPRCLTIALIPLLLSQCSLEGRPRVESHIKADAKSDLLFLAGMDGASKWGLNVSDLACLQRSGCLGLAFRVPRAGTTFEMIIGHYHLALHMASLDKAPFLGEWDKPD